MTTNQVSTLAFWGLLLFAASCSGTNDVRTAAEATQTTGSAGNETQTGDSSGQSEEEQALVDARLIEGFDLSILASGPEGIEPGVPFVVELTAAEAKNAVDVEIRLTLPDGVTLVSGADCEAAAGVVDCFVTRALLAGSPQTISVELVLDAGTTLGSADTVEIEAFVSDDVVREAGLSYRDENPDDNTTTLTLTLN